MRPKGLSPTLYSALALAALALIFTTNAVAVSEKVIHNLIIYPHGASPIGNLVADAKGNLYGTAFNGGDHGYGAVFQLTRKPNGKWVETILHSFEGPVSTEGGTKDGWFPIGGLTFDTSGNLYGTTEFGGNLASGDGYGTVFALAPVGGDRFSYSTIYRFKGKNDGAYPNGAVVVDAAGNLYGTSNGAGLANGTVFELVHSSKGWTAKTSTLLLQSNPKIWLSTLPAGFTGSSGQIKAPLEFFSLSASETENGRRIRCAAVAHRWGFQASTRAAIYSSVLRARYSSWCESKTGR
jgi:uncharacterized repeat protein (TIGR03803 family)